MPADPTNAREQAIAKVLAEHGIAPNGDGDLHGWRCKYPEVYGQFDCECVSKLVADLLALPPEAPVAPDKEKLAKALYAIHPFTPGYPTDLDQPMLWEELHQNRRDLLLADADALLASPNLWESRAELVREVKAEAIEELMRESTGAYAGELLRQRAAAIRSGVTK